MEALCRHNSRASASHRLSWVSCGALCCSKGRPVFLGCQVCEHKGVLACVFSSCSFNGLRVCCDVPCFTSDLPFMSVLLGVNRVCCLVSVALLFPGTSFRPSPAPVWFVRPCLVSRGGAQAAGSGPPRSSRERPALQCPLGSPPTHHSGLSSRPWVLRVPLLWNLALGHGSSGRARAVSTCRLRRGSGPRVLQTHLLRALVTSFL